MARDSKTSLIKKLGIEPEYTMRLYNQPEYYLGLLEELPHGVVQAKDEDKYLVDFIHYFIQDLKSFADELPNLQNQIKQNGMIWISWDKTISKAGGAVNENLIRQRALSLDLVDVKVCAVDETWSGLKLVIRKERRKKKND